MKYTALLSLTLALVCAMPCVAAPRNVVVVGFVETTEPDFYESTITPTVSAIEKALPGYSVRLERLSTLTLLQDIDLYKPDLLVAPVSDTVTLMDQRAGVHPVATRKTILARDPNRSVGGTVIVRADRDDLTRFEDLAQTRLVATLPNAIDGWLALCYAFLKTPSEMKQYFQVVDFIGYGFPTVISGVLSGAYDAGVIPACLLERVEEDGLVAKGALKVLNRQADNSLACQHSTALFPDLVATTLPGTDPQLTKTLTLALLSTTTTKAGYSWQVSSDFHAVRTLQETLHLGLWSYLDDRSLTTLWNRYSGYVLGVLALLVFLLLNEWRLRRLVKKRTKELVLSFAERDQLRQAEQQAKAKLEQLEHMSALSQLCAMIAHELKQPVTSVINYTAILQMKLRGEKYPSHTSDETVLKAIQGTEREAKRIARIVDRVRSYAKRDRSEHEAVNLLAALRTALKEVERYRVGQLDVAPEVLHVDRFVLGNALELELLFINILKNAFEALAHAKTAVPNPSVTVHFEETADTLRLSIRDNGPAVSDATFAKLKEVSESIKPDGLGLGLAIVRNIADEHGAVLHIERLNPCGIEVSLAFPRTEDPRATQLDRGDSPL